MELLMSALRSSVPLIFAAQGGLLSERSGIINIALEGFMLIGAFSAACVAYWTGNPWLAWLAATCFGALLAALYGVSVIHFKTNHVVAGTAINIFIIGLIPFLGKIIFNSTGSTPSLAIGTRFTFEPLIMAILLTFFIYFFLNYTFIGLQLMACGENPEVVTTAGLSVTKIRWRAVLLSGALAAMGGATLSIAMASSYSPLMSAGRGFVALAAMITGRWKPLHTLVVCFLFGLIDAAQIHLQGLHWGAIKIPVSLIQVVPYIITLIVLALFTGAQRAPQSLGKD